MINVQVRTVSGKVLRSAGGPGVDDFFQVGRESYPLLAHVVPWTDTAFNKSQVKSLVEEIDRYEADLTVNSEGYPFDWLRELCSLVTEEPHRMLWFVGD
jgi:hypothetical protein